MLSLIIWLMIFNRNSKWQFWDWYLQQIPVSGRYFTQSVVQVEVSKYSLWDDAVAALAWDDQADTHGL